MKSLTTIAVQLMLLASLVFPLVAQARRDGIIASECNGCHTGGSTPDVDVTFDPSNPSPGATVHVTVAIEAVNGNVGGIFVGSNGPGHFVLTDSYTELVDEDGFWHTQPKPKSGNTVTFTVDWVAPNEPGGVDFDVSTLSANDDDTQGGDSGRSLRKSFAYGCAGITYYRDNDGDGYGGSAQTTLACAVPEFYSANDDDCDDNDERVYPGAQELCNGRDDDCDTFEDDGLDSVQLYPDNDDDGYGGRTGVPIDGCVGSGYGVGNSDCDDDDPTSYPGGKEVCDYADNNCDGRDDERVKPVCGIGRCARESYGCDLDTCYPGDPRDELCNLLDDDCNGIVDDGEPCASGQVCEKGVCKEGSSGAAQDGGGSGGGGCAAADSGLTALVALVIVAARKAAVRSPS